MISKKEPALKTKTYIKSTFNWKRLCNPLVQCFIKFCRDIRCILPIHLNTLIESNIIALLRDQCRLNKEPGQETQAKRLKFLLFWSRDQNRWAINSLFAGWRHNSYSTAVASKKYWPISDVNFDHVIKADGQKKLQPRISKQPDLTRFIIQLTLVGPRGQSMTCINFLMFLEVTSIEF